MYKISRVKITGFWERHTVDCTFQDDITVLIGRNGTGKTTFMELLRAAISVDAAGLCDNDFNEITIELKDHKKKKTIKLTKTQPNFDDYEISYKISRQKPITIADPRYDRVGYFRRRSNAASIHAIKEQMNELICLSSLSVHRNDEADKQQQYEGDRGGKQNDIKRSLVDIRLESLMIGLTQYNFELAKHEKDILNKMQQEVLLSVIDTSITAEQMFGEALEFDPETSRRRITDAYRQLGVHGREVIKKINTHIKEVDTVSRKLKDARDESAKNGHSETTITEFEITPLLAFEKARAIMGIVSKAQEQCAMVFKPISSFIEIVHEFIPDKKFIIDPATGRLTVIDPSWLDVARLSSGEKQLLILLTETLLQRSKSYTFMTDEPEISLHISWQRKIIPTITKLNPNAQIIVATHSPEVAGNYNTKIVNMAKLTKLDSSHGQ